MENTIALTNFLFRVIDWMFQLASLLIIARVFVSWIFPGRQRNPFVDFIYRTTEPILAPIRQQLFRITGHRMGFDISPMVAILLLFLARYFLFSFLRVLLS